MSHHWQNFEKIDNKQNLNLANLPLARFNFQQKLSNRCVVLWINLYVIGILQLALQLIHWEVSGL